LYYLKVKKITFFVTLPVWIGYLFFGWGWYIYTKDDLHFSALNDIVSWFFE